VRRPAAYATQASNQPRASRQGMSRQGPRQVLFCYPPVCALPWAGVGVVGALVRACGALSPAELREQALTPTPSPNS